MVEAQGVRGFRKSLDQSCRLDPLIVSHHNSLDAACCSGKRNPGKAVPALPCFSCSSWAPPAKPSPSGSAFTCAHRARRRTAIPHRSPAEGGTPAGELRLGTFPGAMPQCEQGRRQADLFLPLAAASVPPFRLQQGRCCAAPAPTCPGRDSLQVFSVPAHNVRVPSSQFPISTRAGKKRRKLTF